MSSERYKDEENFPKWKHFANPHIFKVTMVSCRCDLKYFQVKQDVGAGDTGEGPFKSGRVEQE